MDFDQIRNRYLKFFERNNHVIIPSSSLIPENDSTTLFTGSGMQPIVPYLLGEPHPQGRRIVNSQKCFRAEDMDEVGDNRHTTFFEMLGNWSLGDPDADDGIGGGYFKKEQIPWFFSFLVDDLEISPDRLYVTVFAGDEKLNLPKDTESVEIWKELFKKKGIEAKEVVIGDVKNGNRKGMQEGRIFFYDSEKNWWSRAGKPEEMPAGEPGGPDSEVFYEFTEVEHDKRYGEHCHVNCECGRYMEIGNNVFMEYVKAPEGTFKRLPQRNVDFGGGLERIAAVLANSPDVFKVSVFSEIIKVLEGCSGKQYESVDEYNRRSFRIIADHLRAAVFIVADGVEPGNKDRGYIARRLIRRSLLNAKQLSIQGTDWLPLVINTYAENYKDFYSEIDDRQELIQKTIISEAEKFLQTLESGLKQFDKIAKKKTLDSKDIFDLYQSYGFPDELSIELAKERGLSVDKSELEILKKQHQTLSRKGLEKKFRGGLSDTSEMSVRYHTATHLLNQALRDVLGKGIYQKGSNITPERLRFDFPYENKLTNDQIAKVEGIVNEKISAHLPVNSVSMPLTEATEKGVIGVFGERYPDTVTVYRVGEARGGYYSQEICGGPHVSNTKELSGPDGLWVFKIKKEEAISKGVRRIKATLE